jgi:hypothetical protein
MMLDPRAHNPMEPGELFAKPNRSLLRHFIENDSLLEHFAAPRHEPPLDHGFFSFEHLGCRRDNTEIHA